MLETPYATNSWAQGPMGPWAQALGRAPEVARRKRGAAAAGLSTGSRGWAAPRLRLAASGARPKAWAQGPMGPAHGPRAHELEAYGVSSIRGF